MKQFLASPAGEIGDQCPGLEAGWHQGGVNNTILLALTTQGWEAGGLHGRTPLGCLVFRGVVTLADCKEREEMVMMTKTLDKQQATPRSEPRAKS